MPELPSTRLSYTEWIETSNYKEWNNRTSKLHNMKPRIEECESIYRKLNMKSLILSRLRIGHKKLTREYLMSRND